MRVSVGVDWVGMEGRWQGRFRKVEMAKVNRCWGSRAACVKTDGVFGALDLAREDG